MEKKELLEKLDQFIGEKEDMMNDITEQGDEEQSKSVIYRLFGAKEAVSFVRDLLK